MSRFRQYAVAPEFRIPGPDWFIASLEDVREAIGGAAEAGGHTGAARQDRELISRVAVAVWRARRKLALPGGQALARELDRLVQSAWDALVQGGVEVRDHTGEDVSGGESFRVLAYEPAPGLRREQVIETVRPTVYYQGSLIQEGQVIVGTPSGPRGETAQIEPGGDGLDERGHERH